MLQYSNADKNSLEEGNEKLPEENNSSNTNKNSLEEGIEKLPEENNSWKKIFASIGARFVICLSVMIIICLVIMCIVVCFVVLSLGIAFLDYYRGCYGADNCFAYFWILIPNVVIQLDIPPGQFLTSFVRAMMLIIGITLFVLELVVCIVIVVLVGCVLILGIVCFWCIIPIMRDKYIKSVEKVVENNEKI